MENTHDFDPLLDRHFAPPSAPRHLGTSSRLRSSWDLHGPAVRHGVVCAAVAVATWSYRLPLVSAGVAAFGAWGVLRLVLDQRAERAALEADADFLAAERERLEHRLRRERVAFLAQTSFAAVLALTAQRAAHPESTLVAAAVIAVIALVRVALFAPGLHRELAELGGDPKRDRLLAILVFGLGVFAVLALPFALVFHGVRGFVRRVRGLPPQERE